MTLPHGAFMSDRPSRLERAQPTPGRDGYEPGTDRAGGGRNVETPATGMPSLDSLGAARVHPGSEMQDES